MHITRSIRHRLATGLAIAIIGIQTIGAAMADEPLEWWKINSEVGKRLASGEKNLIDWAGELSETEAKTPRDAVVKLSVCMRAALDDAACDAVRTLWHLAPEKVNNFLATNCYYAATDNCDAWELAKTIIETFAPRIHEAALENRLFKHYRAKDNPQRWSDEEFIAWLDARIESVRRYDRKRMAEEKQKANSDAGTLGTNALMRFRGRPVDFWRRLRFRHLAEMGRAEAELKRMSDAIRARPAHAALVLEYLTALKDLPNSKKLLERENLDWLAEVSRATRATDLRDIASSLVDLGQCKPAETFFRRALETKVTDEEITQMAMMCQAMLPQQTHRLWFRVRLLEDLAKCLLKQGKNDLSQKFMVEAADMRRENKMSANPYLSGLVQGVSGARTIENRIRKQEKTDKNDPEYWLDRAVYYRGRKERGEEETALRRALELTRPAPRPRGKAPSPLHSQALSRLAKFLISEKRPEEATNLLLAELDKAPVDTDSSGRAAYLLGYDLPKQKHLSPDEPILWRWIERREKWDYTEERLIWRMLEAAPAESRDACFARAEKLAMAEGAHPTRAATLGWILNRMDEPARSIPLLKHAVETTTDDELKQKASFTLLESYLDTKDWQAAEAIFEFAAKRLTPAEYPEWLGRVAIMAAKKGDKTDAMRIFRRVANINIRPVQLVEQLAKLGLEDELRAYYGEARRRLPKSNLVGLAP